MLDFQRELADLLYASGAIRFGDFQLKSGGRSPYFINFGEITDGVGLSTLGSIYASCLKSTYADHGFDVIVGPAYKGIPLATTAAVSLASNHKIHSHVLYNRKEAKQHGADVGTQWVGPDLEAGSRLVIIDDVFTSGGTKVETIEQLKASWPEAEVVGLIVGVDRLQPKSLGGESMQEFCDQRGIHRIAILDTHQLVDYLNEENKLDSEKANEVRQYIKGKL